MEQLLYCQKSGVLATCVFNFGKDMELYTPVFLLHSDPFFDYSPLEWKSCECLELFHVRIQASNKAFIIFVNIALLIVETC